MIRVGLPFEIRNVRNVKNVRRGVVSIFQRIPDIKFCKSCGYMVAKRDSICICGNSGVGGFLNGDIAETLGGYLLLNRNKLLKGYYLKKSKSDKYVTNKSVMNNKRTVVWLLVHSDRLVMWNDTETIDVIYKAFKNDGFKNDRKGGL